MIRRSMLVIAAVGGLGVGVVAVGPAADASRTHAAPHVTITSASPAEVNTPTLVIKHRDPKAHLASGDIFAGPKFDGAGTPPGPVGPEIVDDHGRPIYFKNSKAGDRATDVRSQMYNGRPVFTYWLGHTGANPGVGEGNDHILNSKYQTIRIVHGHGTLDGEPIMADQHEFLLTPGNSAIIICYALTRIDARKWGGAANQLVYDSIAEEINLANGKMVFEWRALTHVSPGQSHQPPPTDPNTHAPLPNVPWDYFHMNAVRIDSDHNLIISARHTWTIYKVNRHHGNIMWQLQTGLTSGGKYTTGAQSNFKIGSGAAFAWQHDPEPLGNDTYRIFDNNWNMFAQPQQPAHVLTVHLNMATKTAVDVGHIYYSGPTMYAGSQGDTQLLPGSHILIGWGAGSDITEVNANRQQIFDAQYSNAFNTYRAYKMPWVGTPATFPTVSMHTVGGKKQVDVVWNGANQVARWRILSGPNTKDMASVGSVAWNGLDTAFRLSTYRAYVKAVALSASGKVLGRTAATHT